MTRIGLISDTHGYLDEAVFTHFKNCDEIWHGGDFGTIDIADRLRAEGDPSRKTPVIFKGVYGNVDGYDVRSIYPEKLLFTCEEVNVFMIHIGIPYFNKSKKQGFFNPLPFREELGLRPPQLFISGHSHILKIIYDDQVNCLYMNPGAAGKQGWQKVRTVIRFAIDGKEIKDCEVIELGK